jgi:aminopeptidase
MNVVCRSVRDRSGDIKRLADLLVGFGANLQPGQILGVTAYLGMEDAARAVARAAYKRGAKYVDVFWWDLLVKRARLELAEESTLDFIPPGIEARMEWLSRDGALRACVWVERARSAAPTRAARACRAP